MKKLIILPLLAAAFLTACTESPEQANYEKTAGCYTGTVPAADAPGMDVTITLNADKTYQRTSVFLEKEAKFEETGTWTIDEQKKLVLTPKDGSAYPMQADEGKIVFLMPDGTKIEGETAAQYVLNRCAK